MTKKGPLGKAETYYVRGHYKDQEVDEIAKDLDRAVITIQRQVDEFKALEAPVRTTAGDQMARREGLVTMTEASSSTADASREVSLPRRTKECVTQTKGGVGLTQGADE
jgi:hypothetical protein